MSKYFTFIAFIIAVLSSCNKSAEALEQTTQEYSMVSHPDWSVRVKQKSAVVPNSGSGDYDLIYLVDVRKVSIPLQEAKAYYENEGKGMKEFHVDSYEEAQLKFVSKWKHVKLGISKEDDLLIITQLFQAPE